MEKLNILQTASLLLISAHLVHSHLIPTIGILKTEHGCIRALADVVVDVLDGLHGTAELHVDVDIECFG